MGSLQKSRSLFLFGAGAAMDWSGPSTPELTQRVCKSGFKNKSGKFITEVIYDWLKESSGLPENEVNFETIINVIEDISEYWLRSISGQINGLAFPLKNFKSDNWEEILNFEVSEKFQNGYYSMKIPGASEYIQMELESVRYDKYPSPEAKYFEMLLRDLFTVLQAAVSEYSYITSTHSRILSSPKNQEINELAISYFKKKSEGSLLRLYTLNYDRISQFIFHNIGIEVDQGFNDHEIFPKSVAHFNPFRTFRNVDMNCIYHLHGSIFWGVESVNQNSLSDYKFVHYPGPILQANHSFARFEMEKGKELLIGNIITGYRKSQRTSLSPFRQMFNAFDRDCYTANELLIVGYSFGDQHINDIINKAREVNEDLRIGIVDPSIDVDAFLLNHASKWKWFSQVINRQTIVPNVIYIPFLKLTFYRKTLKEFLRLKENSDIV